MPGFDGTGPEGRGPMTGKADGYCVLKKPGTPGEPGTGIAGLAGRPVNDSDDSRKMDMALLQSRLQAVQLALQELRLRLTNLEAGDRGCSMSVIVEDLMGSSHRRDGSPS